MPKNQTISVSLNSNNLKITAPLWSAETTKTTSSGFFHSDIKISGIWRGQIKNLENFKKSFEENIREIKKNLNSKEFYSYITFSNSSVKSQVANASIALSKADGEVGHKDIERIFNEIERKGTKVNQKILFIEPIKFFLDNSPIEGRPEGLKGQKLSCEALIISTSSQFVNDVTSIFEKSGVKVLDILPDAISASNICLTERDIYAGVGVLNIGYETTSVAIYDNGTLVFVESYPIGTTDIINDICLLFQIDAEEAEGLKNGTIIGNYPKKKVDDIILARFEDIFSAVNNDLKNLKLNGLLPAGIRLCGEGALIDGVEEIGKKILKIPVKIAEPKTSITNIKFRDVSWFANYGFWVIKKDNRIFDSNVGWLKELNTSIKNIFKQLLP